MPFFSFFLYFCGNKMNFFCIFLLKNLYISKNSSNFARFFGVSVSRTYVYTILENGCRWVRDWMRESELYYKPFFKTNKKLQCLQFNN